MKGDTRLMVRQAALVSLGSDTVVDLIESEMWVVPCDQEVICVYGFKWGLMARI